MSEVAAVAPGTAPKWHSLELSTSYLPGIHHSAQGSGSVPMLLANYEQNPLCLSLNNYIPVALRAHWNEV